ncbi:MAG: hypothetical protein CTY10_09000 [Methylotenera sp.]|nr:MAG: hypothetical protein CTY10_09000 [Methylotenera sp.]
MAIEFKKYIQHEKCLSDLDKLNKELIHMKDRYTDVLIENSQCGLKTSEMQVELRRQIVLQQALVDAFNNELLLGTLKSYKFEPKRKKGAIGKVQQQINLIVDENPNVTTPEILSKLDNSIINRLANATLLNKISQARNRKK